MVVYEKITVFQSRSVMFSWWSFFSSVFPKQTTPALKLQLAVGSKYVHSSFLFRRRLSVFMDREGERNKKGGCAVIFSSSACVCMCFYLLSQQRKNSCGGSKGKWLQQHWSRDRELESDWSLPK